MFEVFYLNMIYVTCAVYGLNRDAEEIRLLFSLVNNLISLINQIFIIAIISLEYYDLKQKYFTQCIWTT